ncbi:16S rRNA (uracil(1498)-N(3))-methyltransferase [Flexithrix dorotheae]|uniref:16S rRNA (uracil(1498)-N(3))-methyltransferase n=1 Tax=Flexithrix dorotheae TaxID=70993 RepID=UPI00036590F3|nr:RsmE family RNA methyltransferase [Flexithrix dorotheae]
MNLILFDQLEIEQNKISVKDHRSKHILKILKAGEGDEVDIGIINKDKGKALIERIENDFIHFSFRFYKEDVRLHPIKVILGFIRPVNVQRVVKDLATLGVSDINFVGTEKGEKSYAQSKMYAPENLKKYLIEGAEQAFSTRLTNVFFYKNLEDCLKTNLEGMNKIALDNYEATGQLSQSKFPKKTTMLAIGSERGWSDKERQFFRAHKFTLASMGNRVLRSETACVSAVSIALAKMNLI